MVTKTLLQYLMLLAPDPDFPELWARILQVLQVVCVPFCFVSSSLLHVLLLWACIVCYRTHLGVHSASPAGCLPSALLCQQQLAACVAVVGVHHFVTKHIWACILQALQVVYLPLCLVRSSLQRVLLLWSCIRLSQNTSDCVLCLRCSFVSKLLLLLEQSSSHNKFGFNKLR